MRKREPKDVLDLIRARTKEASNGCFEWTGHIARQGYGRLMFGGKPWWAHRLVYTLRHGEIPKGMHIDHLCRNRRCVRVDHLEVVTPAENIRRGIGPTAVNARKTHCIHGHAFDAENTKYTNGGTERKEQLEEALKALEPYYSPMSDDEEEAWLKAFDALDGRDEKGKGV